MTDWRVTQSTEPFKELSIASPTTYIQAKDMHEIQLPSSVDGETFTAYEAMTRFLTKDEYHMLQSIEAIDSSKAVDAFTMELIEEGIL